MKQDENIAFFHDTDAFEKIEHKVTQA